MTSTNLAVDLHRVHKIRPSGTAAASDVLAEAFQDDPVFAWCIPGATRRRRLLPGLFGVIVDGMARHGETYVTADQQSVALWVPPDRPPLSEADEVALGDVLVSQLGDDAQRFFELSALMAESHPHESHFYLWLLAVDPARQGEGLGSLLLSSMLRRCDEEGVPAYLEATSELNRALYERHGFEVTGEIGVAGAPPLWPMWRQPRS